MWLATMLATFRPGMEGGWDRPAFVARGKRIVIVKPADKDNQSLSIYASF
jgi:hypothetical protein